MAFARTATVTHNKVATAADDPTKEINRGEWNDAHAFTSAVSGATSGGIPYFSSTMSEASSALLAANAAVMGGGAATAPYSSTKISEGTAAGQGLIVAAGTAVTNVAALSITQTWNNAACATGIKYVLTDTLSAGGALPVQVLGGAAGATNLLSIDVNGSLTLGGGIIANSNIRTGATNAIFWNSRAILYSPADNVLRITNQAENKSAYLSSVSDGILAIGTGADGSVAGSASMNNCKAVSYTVGTTAGASFGPGLPTSITVVNGIITAIS